MPIVRSQSPFFPLNHFIDFLVDYAVDVAFRAIFTNAAQNCVAGSRTFVHSKIYDQFITKSTELAKKRVLGDPFDSNTEQGPQVTNLLNLRIIVFTFLVGFRLIIVNSKRF